MRIRYSEFHPDPSLRNTLVDLKPHIAEQVIGSGLAKSEPYKTYQERFRAESVEASKLPPAQAAWGISDSFSKSVPFGLLVTKSLLGTSTVYEYCPDDAPQRIKDQYAYKVAQVVAANGDAGALEKAKRDAGEYNEKAKSFRRF